MALSKLYSRINWENYPSEETPINKPNLNRMDDAIDSLDNRVIEQESLKFDKTSAAGLIKEWVIDEQTGIITITKYNGEKVLFDLNIEKIPVSFALSEDGILTMTADDGTAFTADIGSMIPVLTFEASDTIAATVSGTGANKSYSFSIKAGSVTGDMLEPNYLANVQVAAGQASGAADAAAASAAEAKASEQSASDSEETAILKASEASASASSASSSESAALASKNTAESAKTDAVNAKNTAVTKAEEASASAQAATDRASSAASSQTDAASSAQIAGQNAQEATDEAILAKSYAVGGTGTRPGEDTNNAMYYMQQAMSQTGGIPTKLSQLQNDTGFITVAVDNLINYYKASQLYTKTEIDTKLSTIPKFGISVVEKLPTANISEITIYLLKEEAVGTNKCSEWIYVNGEWESIGSIEIDLSGYLTTTGDGSSLTETFAPATTLENIVSGESHNTIFGKVAKSIATLISHAGTAATASILGHVKVDISLSSISTNPVQNKAVNAALGNKLATTGDASNVTTSFTEATSLQELTSGEKLNVSMGKLKCALQKLKKIITLFGSTDISAIGDGTVTGALNVLNSNLHLGDVLIYNPDTDYFGFTHDGIWKDILFAGLNTHYLYKDGDVCVSTSGGWGTFQYSFNDNDINDGSIVAMTDAIHLKKSSESTSVLGTGKKINTNGFHNLCIELNVSKHVDLSTLIKLSLNMKNVGSIFAANFNLKNYLSTLNAVKIIKLPINSYQGEYYLSFLSSTAWYSEGAISKIWLE